MIKPIIAPPICAKCATFPTEYFVTPKNKSPSNITGIKYLAAMGTGKKIKANFAFGYIIPNATNIPYTAPEAPKAGVL